MSEPDVQKHSVHTLVFRSLKRTHDMFLSDQRHPPPQDDKAEKLKMSVKAKDEYKAVIHLVASENAAIGGRAAAKGASSRDGDDRDDIGDVATGDPAGVQRHISDMELVPSIIMHGTTGDYGSVDHGQMDAADVAAAAAAASRSTTTQVSQALALAGVQQKSLTQRKPVSMPRPRWHPPWKLYRVISGHLGWVRCVTVEPGNQWFATGSADRVIKIWDLASGKLKLSLTGHISTVRGLAVSPRQPYLFSCGEDKQVKCWDLEYNKVIRHYHGHLSAIYSIALHPTIDVLVTAGRDSVARVWDMRTKANIHTFTGHSNTVAQVLCQASEPQIITGSHDCTIRLWDLAAGKSLATLTNHKKSVRALVIHPILYMFASGSPDNIKQWMCPEGKFIQNLSGHNAIVNCLGLNSDSVLVSGGDNGTLHFWDWKTGYNFQRIQAPVQPGSIDSEAGVFACTFDQSGSRLLTAEADKTIKLYREDDTATEESFPISWKPDILKRRRY